MESSISLTPSKQEENDDVVKHIIDTLLVNLDNILYRKHIQQTSQNTVFDALESALYDFINRYFIGEKFTCLCTANTFQLDNDHELKELSKDSNHATSPV